MMTAVSCPYRFEYYICIQCLVGQAILKRAWTLNFDPLSYSMYLLSFSRTRQLHRLESLYPQAPTMTSVMLRERIKYTS